MTIDVVERNFMATDNNTCLDRQSLLVLIFNSTMAIPLLRHKAASWRRILASANTCCSTANSTGIKRLIWGSYNGYKCRKSHSLRYYSMSSSLTANRVMASLVSSESHRHRRPCETFFFYDTQQSHRTFSDSKDNVIINTDHIPFFNASKLPPSSSSILKQEDYELSAEELRLKKALQEYFDEREDGRLKMLEGRADNENFKSETDFVLDNLQQAYIDLEYWEEALHIEVYKCQLYLSKETDEYADSIHAQGKFRLRQEDFINSKNLYGEALDYFERTENLVQQGHVLISLAGWYFFRNQLDDALESLQRSETMLDSNPALLYKCLDNQGLIYRLWGEFHMALDKYQQALQVVVTDDSETRSALKMHIADMYLALEEPNEALREYHDLLTELPSVSTAITHSEQHKLGIRGVLLHNIATIHVDQGDHQLALDQFLEALEAKKLAGGEHNPEVAKTLNSLGALHAGSFGEKESALEYFQQALLIARIHAKDRENPHDDPDVINILQNISVIEQ